MTLLARGIIRHTESALAHYRETCPDLTRTTLIASSANSVITQILEHGEMGDDADLAEAIAETELLLAALQRARTARN